MTVTQTDPPTSRRPLRLWPGVVAALVILLVRFGAPVIGPNAMILAVIGPVVGGLAIIVWWLFFSRSSWPDRLGALALMIVAALAASRFVHRSVATGMMGMMFPIFALPVLSLALVGWAAASRHLSSVSRRVSLVGATLLACGALTLLRTGGITGEGVSDLHWRWTATPEERLLARGGDDAAPGASSAQPAAPTVEPEKVPAQPGENASASTTAQPTPETHDRRSAAPPIEHTDADRTHPASAKAEAEWPGFRGPGRDSVVRGVRIATDWSAAPPVQLWRRPIGPGWSSFAVRGDLLYTQEQRGDEEVVSCYRVATGQPVWRHRDPVRFWESNGGAGPRATPTLSANRVYTFGATGILNALDADTGAVVWSRNVASEIGGSVPMWGFASSPLVVDDVVIVAATGTLVAYDLATGTRRWSGPAHGGSYSSPHRSTIDGVTQVVLLNGAGATSVVPANGKLLWEYAWPGTTIVQPAVMADNDLLITTGGGTGGMGIRRLAVARGPGGWKVEERWTSTGLKPYFNDFVVHKGHAFGFDGSILSSIDLEDGKRKWKGGRYGNGQLVLLPDQDLLLVLSEEGELALVGATPDQFRELARFQAIEGKTWNHPALVGDILLVRNGEEMAAFRLSPASR